MRNLKTQTAVIVAVLITALAAVFLLQKHTISSVNRVSEQTALTLLSENAGQVREVLNKQLSSIWGKLDMVDRALNTIGDMTTEETVTYLRECIPDACRVLLVSKERHYIDQNGNEGDLELTESLYPLFRENQRVCIPTRTTLLFATPVTAGMAGEVDVEYLMVCYRLDSFMDLLSVESYAGNGKIRIVDTEGRVLLHTDNLKEEKVNYDFFQDYESAQFMESQGIKDFQGFKDSVLSGENHAVHVLTKSGDNTVISYAKITGMDWYVTIAVDYESVLGELDRNIMTIGKSSIMATMFVVLLAIILVLIISLDIHKEKIEKQQLKELNQSLEHAKEVADEALQIAENANRSKSNFLSNMSHDIRTPMNAILGFATLMNADADNPEKVREYTRKITASGQHLLGLVNDVLDMSRIESGKTTLNLSEESMSEIVDGIDTILRPQMNARGHRLDVDVHHIVHDRVVVDKIRLNQICINLLSNAVKYTPDNGHIRFEITESYVSGHVAHYRILVADNGYGMSREFQQHVFDSFSREDDGRTSKIQGTGLGMAITKNLVDLMGGSISLKSEKGVGTTFTVDIPLQLSRSEAEPEFREEHEITCCSAGELVLAGKHILVAEDNELNGEILRDLLEMNGATCEICADGKQIVDAFMQSEPGDFDFILMDVQMPVMNGYEATRAIRQSSHPLAQTIPIIAMTANAFTEDIQDALQAGMNAHVAKPLDMSVLEATVKQVI
ncbi:MAG: ATP-binding protein [Lachnospiraceae bacterium]